MAAENKPLLAYIGTYTEAKSKGIYVSRFDPETGTLTAPELAAETKNPTFLALHHNGRLLYAVGEFDSFQGKRGGAVSAFAIDGGTGKLNLLNQKPSGGAGPCHLAVDKTGKCLLVANYGSGSFAALPIESDGKLGELQTQIQQKGSSVDRERQAGPHAHFITVDPANRFALGCDLGVDKVMIWKLQPAKALLDQDSSHFASIQPGSGPRHLAFYPNGRIVYLINEMAATLVVFSYDPEEGALKELQTVSSLPDKFTGFKSGAEVEIHPSGKFLYCSNRGHDTIAVFAIDEKSGKLSFVEHQSTQGKTPRHFAIDPAGNYLLAENQDSNNVVVFRINQETGKLTPTGQTVEVGAPVCIQFVPVR